MSITNYDLTTFEVIAIYKYNSSRIQSTHIFFNLCVGMHIFIEIIFLIHKLEIRDVTDTVITLKQTKN